MQIFDKIEALLDAGEALTALKEARALVHQFGRRSGVLAGAIDDLIIDLSTLSFVADAYGDRTAEAARTLARRRLLKIKLLAPRRSGEAPPHRRVIRQNTKPRRKAGLRHVQVRRSLGLCQMQQVTLWLAPCAPSSRAT
ncbi:hypothetical protein [Mesorhizobium sp. M0772]|uniref:hypothetical protein n=1 Tax=Mesorhizobium sp. M0772 TaxID=2956998 RepID=UPI003335901F